MAAESVDEVVKVQGVVRLGNSMFGKGAREFERVRGNGRYMCLKEDVGDGRRGGGCPRAEDVIVRDD
jgi:hypothetical protein